MIPRTPPGRNATALFFQRAIARRLSTRCWPTAAIFPKTDLARFRRPGSHLQGHPYQPKTPGIEASTGTLGLGLSTALGMALGAKLRNQSHYYYVLCGDGELQEGQIWEAALFGSKYKLDNVIAFVDRNYLQTDGNTEDVMPLDPLVEKWQAFGWNAFEIDGQTLGKFSTAIERAKEHSGKANDDCCQYRQGQRRLVHGESSGMA